MSEPADRGPVDDDAEETDLVGRREAVKRLATHTAPGGSHARQRSRIRIGGLMSESSAEERTGTAKKPGESERLDNPPRRSPWDFQNKQPDWHENFYSKMRSRVEIAGDDLS